ncbi:MAG: hypothetical protein R2939_21380 [Kofleriaceae bacterium]
MRASDRARRRRRRRAAVLDAGPTTTCWSQTSSDEITALQLQTPAGATDGTFTRENSYYRAFPLGAAGVVGPFEVSQVSFGVESAVSGDGTQPIDVTLYTYAGTPGSTLTVGALTQLATTTTMVADTELTYVTAPISTTVPAGATLVVEVRSYDGENDLEAFYIGSNAGGESGDGYLRGPDCGITTPTAVDTIEVSGLDTTLIDILITVTGTTGP